MSDLQAHGATAPLAALVVAALILGIAYSPLLGAAPQAAADDETPGGAWFEPEPCPFWSAEESAQYRVECGKLNVPESDAGGRRYRLQVAILRSHGDPFDVDGGVAQSPIFV